MRWVTIASINTRWNPPESMALPYELAKGICLTDLPGWVKSESMLDYLSWNLRVELRKFAQYCVQVSYEAEALGSPDPQWKGEAPRSAQETAFERLKLVEFSLFLSQPTGFSFSCVIHAHEANSQWFMQQVYEYAPSVPLPAYERLQPSADDFAQSREVFKALEDLRPASNLRTTARVAIRARTETGFALRFLILWLVLESLFGPDDAREITFRLSQRVAFFTSETAEDVRKVFEKVKTSYNWRSKVVHGLRLAKLQEETSLQLITDLEEIVRKSVRKILLDNELIRVFDGKGREDFLDDLLFNKRLK